jgi:hypothetical protein
MNALTTETRCPITIPDGVFPEYLFVQRTMDTMNAAGILFRRGGRIVHVDGSGLASSTPTFLRVLTSKYCEFQTMRGNGQRAQQVAVPLSADLAQLLTTGAQHLRDVRAVIANPCFIPGHDGLPQWIRPGYNEMGDTGYYYVERTLKADDLDAIDRISTEIAATKSKDMIRREMDDLLKEVCFDRQVDKENYIALLLLPMVRPLIKGPVPHHYMWSMIPGAGKSELIEILCRLLLGEPMKPEHWDNAHEDENHKTIFSLVMAGRQIISLDEMKGYIESPHLNKLLTSQVYDSRVFRTQEVSSINHEAIVVSTGNGCTFSEDLMRRTKSIRLKPLDDTPGSRVFDRDIREHIENRRIALLSVLAGAVKIWIAAGCPASATKFGSYPLWHKVMGGIMETIGYENFNADRFEAAKTDESENLSTLFERLLNHESQRSLAMTPAGAVFTSRHVVSQTNGLSIDMGLLTSRKMGGFFTGRILERPVSAFGKIWVMHRHKHGDMHYVILHRDLHYDKDKVIVPTPQMDIGPDDADTTAARIRLLSLRAQPHPIEKDSD